MHTHLFILLGIAASTNVLDLTKMYVAATIVPVPLDEWWRLASRAKDRKQWGRKAAQLQLPDALSNPVDLPVLGRHIFGWLIRRGSLPAVPNGGVVQKKATRANTPLWV